MFDSALCRFLRQVNEYRLMMDRGKDFLHQVLRCNCERRGVDARMAAEARVFQNGLVNDQLHLVFPAAVTLCCGFLTIRMDDTTVMDFMRHAVRYFLSTQQYYEWR